MIYPTSLNGFQLTANIPIQFELLCDFKCSDLKIQLVDLPRVIKLGGRLDISDVSKLIICSISPTTFTINRKKCVYTVRGLYTVLEDINPVRIDFYINEFKVIKENSIVTLNFLENFENIPDNIDKR